MENITNKLSQSVKAADLIREALKESKFALTGIHKNVRIVHIDGNEPIIFVGDAIIVQCGGEKDDECIVCVKRTKKLGSSGSYDYFQGEVDEDEEELIPLKEIGTAIVQTLDGDEDTEE